MALDKVKLLKVEYSPEGNDDDSYPTEIDPTEDYVACKGVAIDGGDVIYINSDSSNITFTDTISGTKPLKDFSYNINSITTTATAGDESVIIANTGGGAFTLNLPDATLNSEKVYFISKIDSSSNKLTVDPYSTQTISGDTTITLKKYEALTIISDGSNWQVL